jgi:hypothetical protein
MPVTQQEIIYYGLRLRQDWLTLNKKYTFLSAAVARLDEPGIVVPERERWVLKREHERVYHALCQGLPEIEEREW